jgi:hypothetical protein
VGWEGIRGVPDERGQDARGRQRASCPLGRDERDGCRPAGIGFLCPPSNLRAPQATRLHPDEPFFCWVQGHDEDFRIEQDKPLVSRYRFVVADRTPGAAEMERCWSAYAEAPRVRLSVLKK